MSSDAARTASVERLRRTALVLYGSETGTAQDVAEEMGRISERLHFDTRVTELNAISLNDLVRYDVVLIAISTTGQGDLPSNAQAFWKRLRSARLRPGCLQKMSFTSFGLGDSSYPKFNWAHRKLSNRLKQLEAQSFCDRGEADEQHPEGTEACFLPWATTLKEKLLERFPLPNGVSPLGDDAFLLPKWYASIQPFQGQESGSLDQGGPGESHPIDDLIPIKDALPATLVENKRLTPVDHWQDVRFFEFDVPHVDYKPGDVLTVYPKNFAEDVDEMLRIMDWTDKADDPLVFKPWKSNIDATYPQAPVDTPSTYNLTLRKLLTNHLDITAIPRRSFFAYISHFTSDDTQRERLLEFTDPTLIDELYDYTTRPRRSILEVLQEFHTVKIPYQYAASIFPSMRGRQFSIASGGHTKFGKPGRSRIQLLVAIVKYKTVIKKIRRGVCTRYMESLKPGQQLNVTLSNSGMKVMLDKPAVMIGPGTGVAPLRSMMQEHAFVKPGDDVEDDLLFFGARNKDADYFFRDEWEAMAKEQGLRVFPAFSRDQSTKIYVQDMIRQNAATVYDIVEKMGGVVYICGSSGKMPQAVREAIVEVFEKQGGMDRDAAEKHLMIMEKAGRYQQETW